MTWHSISNLSGSCTDMSEYVYLLINPHIPQLVKFGYSTRPPEERAIELSQPTGVPGAWTVYHKWEVTDGYRTEQMVFRQLASYREGRQEFFKLKPEKATKLITEAISNPGISPEEERQQREKKRRAEREAAKAAFERERKQKAAEDKARRAKEAKREEIYKEYADKLSTIAPEPPFMVLTCPIFSDHVNLG